MGAFPCFCCVRRMTQNTACVLLVCLAAFFCWENTELYPIFVRGKIKGTGRCKFSLRRIGLPFDTNITVKPMLQIKDLLLKYDTLRARAQHNTVKNFEFFYFTEIDKLLIDGLAQNQDFFSLLLKNEDIKREVLSIFTDEIYRSLRQERQNPS